jgi:sec-independent protein translocase protein TatB
MDGIFGIGGNELIVIILLAAIVLGPERLARSARQIGRFIKNVKSYLSSLSSELQAELHVLDEIDKAKKDLMK